MLRISLDTNTHFGSIIRITRVENNDDGFEYCYEFVEDTAPHHVSLHHFDEDSMFGMSLISVA